MDLDLVALMERPQNFEIIFSDGEFYIFEKGAVAPPRTSSKFQPVVNAETG